MGVRLSEEQKTPWSARRIPARDRAVCCSSVCLWSSLYRALWAARSFSLFTAEPTVQARPFALRSSSVAWQHSRQRVLRSMMSSSSWKSAREEYACPGAVRLTASLRRNEYFLSSPQLCYPFLLGLSQGHLEIQGVVGGAKNPVQEVAIAIFVKYKHISRTLIVALV